MEVFFASLEALPHETIFTESPILLPDYKGEVEFGMMYSQANEGKRGAWSNNWSNTRRELFRMQEYTIEIRWYQVDRGLLEVEDARGSESGISTSWIDLYDRQIRTDRDADASGKGWGDLTLYWKQDQFRYNSIVASKIALTAPTGRHSNVSRGRLGAGQNYWSFEMNVAGRSALSDNSALTFDIGYELPFGRTRRGYVRDFGVHTRDGAGERGVLSSNWAMARSITSTFNLIGEINYAHRFVSGGSGSDMFHFTCGAAKKIGDRLKVKAGYQHPLTGRNAARTRRYTLSTILSF